MKLSPVELKAMITQEIVLYTFFGEKPLITTCPCCGIEYTSGSKRGGAVIKAFEFIKTTVIYHDPKNLFKCDSCGTEFMINVNQKL